MNDKAPRPPSDRAPWRARWQFAPQTAPRGAAVRLRSLFDDDQLGADYGTLEKLPAEYVGGALQQRRGDAAWRLRARAAGGGWLHVLVMLEFQSTTDAAMALRVLECRLAALLAGAGQSDLRAAFADWLRALRARLFRAEPAKRRPSEGLEDLEEIAACFARRPPSRVHGISTIRLASLPRILERRFENRRCADYSGRPSAR